MNARHANDQPALWFPDQCWACGTVGHAYLEIDVRTLSSLWNVTALTCRVWQIALSRMRKESFSQGIPLETLSYVAQQFFTWFLFCWIWEIPFKPLSTKFSWWHAMTDGYWMCLLLFQSWPCAHLSWFLKAVHHIRCPSLTAQQVWPVNCCTVMQMHSLGLWKIEIASSQDFWKLSRLAGWWLSRLLLIAWSAWS